jgi:hypothetical protein
MANNNRGSTNVDDVDAGDNRMDDDVVVDDNGNNSCYDAGNSTWKRY